MDVAYDHITEESLPDTTKSDEGNDAHPKSNVNDEFQEAFKAVSASPWGMKLGGWISQARKQGETYYQDLQKEATQASEQATKGLTSLREQVVNRTRGMTLNPDSSASVPGEEGVPTITQNDEARSEGASKENRPENLPADIVKEAGSLVASLRSTAAARLKDLQAAEDAADEALLKFGMNVRNFLRDAVTITAPDGQNSETREVLFETQEPGTGRKVFHSTRLDAQLHAIHSAPGSFTGDPQGEEWKGWLETFDVEKQTDAIATDLGQYEELRKAMEKLVPEKVEYKMFWTRYYFLRKAIEEDERRRKEVLRGAAGEAEEEVGWDDDEDENESSTPQPHAKASESTTTLNATSGAIETGASDLLKPKDSRRSEDENKSVAGSDASYDMVSGTTTRAAGSPKDKTKDEESDDDWE